MHASIDDFKILELSFLYYNQRQFEVIGNFHIARHVKPRHPYDLETDLCDTDAVLHLIAIGTC